MTKITLLLPAFLCVALLVSGQTNEKNTDEPATSQPATSESATSQSATSQPVKNKKPVTSKPVQKPVQKAEKKDTEVTEPEDLTLNGQFLQLRNKSGNYQKYKVIEKTKLASFWNVVKDSLASYNQEIQMRDRKIDQLKATIDTHLATIKAKTKEVNDHIAVEESITVLGIHMNKKTFKLIFWLLTIALTAGLFYFIFMYKNSNTVTVQKISDFNAIAAELEDRKQKHRDDLVKLKRELQTERNKLEELKQIMNAQKIKYE